MSLISKLLLFCACVFPALSVAQKQTPEALKEVTYNQLKQWYSAKDTWPKIETSDGHQAEEMKLLTLLGDAPDANKVALGKKLFFDTQLSKDNTVSCSSCHEPRMNFGDRRTTAIGIENLQGTRNTPNIFGIDHWQTFFWDGRATTAEQQALMPISNPIEMNFTVEGSLVRVNNDASYTDYIQKAFGTSQINKQQLATAIVEFERTITLPATPFSRFLSKIDKQPEQALNEFTEQELRGLHLFRTKAKCMTCHQGPLLSDNKFHVTGLHFYGRKFQDVGRYDATGKTEDSGKFRTASLLFVSNTGPWMHNGLFSQFDGIVNFYNNGGARPRPRKHVENDPMFPDTTSLLPKLGLSKQEMEDLVAFLKAI